MIKMLKFEERPKKVTAVQVTKDNVGEIAEMVRGKVLWSNGRLFAQGNGTVYPCVEWNTSPNDAEGCWAGQGDWVVQHSWGFSTMRESSFNIYYRKRR